MTIRTFPLIAALTAAVGAAPPAGAQARTRVDTRPPMTRAQCEAAAAFADAGWWATGESLVHVPQVTGVKGWDLYGHPGNASLTEPQRVLMMWSDLVGQVSNGGFSQFAYNYRSQLNLAYRLIVQLDWPEMTERFDRAFREQAGDPARPVLHQPGPEEAASAFDDWLYRDDTKERSREVIRNFAMKHRDALCRITD